VSHFALDLLENQYQQAIQDQPDLICTNLFTRTYGLPCKHQIAEYLFLAQPIPLSTIHSQWILDFNTANRLTQHEIDETSTTPLTPRKEFVETLINAVYGETGSTNLMTRLQDVLNRPLDTIAEPQKVTRKRGRPAGAKNKSTREKSAFEYTNKCGKCGGKGHNARTCVRSK
jgi:hypothetical protein